MECMIKSGECMHAFMHHGLASRPTHLFLNYNVLFKWNGLIENHFFGGFSYLVSLFWYSQTLINSISPHKKN